MKPFDTDRYSADDHGRWPPPPERLQPMDYDDAGSGSLRWVIGLGILAGVAAGLLAAAFMAASARAYPAAVETEQPVEP